MRDLSGPVLDELTRSQKPHINDHPLLQADELEKRTSLAAQSCSSAEPTLYSSSVTELEELQELLHFPEEVALRLADSEYRLFYQANDKDTADGEELEKRTSLAAQSCSSAEPTLYSSSVTELEELQELLHFPEEVALRLADSEYRLFYQVSAWITQLIIAQPTHDARRAIVSCILRVALSCWNIGNFNGAMEIIAGLKSNKLKPFWLSITEKESLPVLDFLSAALLSAEYDRALKRALDMTECPVIPFFGAFLRELREILASCSTSQVSTTPKPTAKSTRKKDDLRDQEQQRQVFISDYDGESHHFTKVGPGGLIDLEKIYRIQAVMDHISLFHQHFHTQMRLSNGATLLDYLKTSPIVKSQRIVAAATNQREEQDEEYEFEISDYHPIQPLVYDHGVSYVCLSPPNTKVDQHIIQILHHGSTAVMWEGIEGPSPPGGLRSTLQYLRLDRSCSTLTWVRPSWSGLRVGVSSGDTDPLSTDFNLSFSPEDTLAPGLLTKLALQSSGEQSTSSTLDEGFLDLMAIKEVHLGGRDAEKDTEIAAVSRRYGLNHEPDNQCALTILYGYGLSDNRILYIVCPSSMCRIWFTGLSWIVKDLARQQALCDRRLLWLREQYLQLYHEDGYCCGPLAADAIRGIGRVSTRRKSLTSFPETSYGLLPWFRNLRLTCFNTSNDARSTEGHHQIPLWFHYLYHLRSTEGYHLILLRLHYFHYLYHLWSVESYHQVLLWFHCFRYLYHLWSVESYHRVLLWFHYLYHLYSVESYHQFACLLTVPTRVSQFRTVGDRIIKNAISVGLRVGVSICHLFRERHGSTEHLWHGRHPRVGSILYDTQLDFIDFVMLFRSFSLLIRKDLRDLFDQLAISYQSMAVSNIKVNGIKHVEKTLKKPPKLGLITRNSPAEKEGIVVNSQKKIYDAIAAASIFTNCAGIDSSNSQVITLSTFMKFLETRQMENKTEDEVKNIIQRHEPDLTLRAQNCLSFEGFARYLMDKDNFAYVYEQEVPVIEDMNKPLSTYYIASSHNTYLTGHQLKGESSVELYSQVLLSGCRCVELDCWDGEDGYPMIYHGHTFTTKIPFSAVVETIDKNAFVVSQYPVILSIENHCSLQQQNKMAQIFQRIFKDKLVSNFLFETDYSDDPSLPSPEQLKNRILIKNKKLIAEVPSTLSSYPPTSTPIRTGIRHSVPGRTSSIISNASSSSFNEDFSDDDFDDEDDDDNVDEKPIHTILTMSESPRTYGPHTSSKTSSTKRPMPDDKSKKRSNQISKELSDLVVYIQAIKFRGLNTSPSNSVKQRTRSSGVSNTGSSVVSNASGSTGGGSSESDVTVVEGDVKQIRSTHPCYQCSSINENAAKKLCRKQPLTIVAHTQTQLMRTYPAGMRIDSSNFNPLIFWSFGIQMAALNYQTDDVPQQINTAMFEMNGMCGYVIKPNVMWDKSHVMYRRFNPWEKEFEGLHSCQIVLTVVSGQYICPNNFNLSTYVEIEIIGIPVDCNKVKTKVVQKNTLNPIWNETFNFRINFQDLCFLRFSIIDASSSHLLAQRILPVKRLKPGYRHLRLRNPQNRPLNMSTLFLYSHMEEESIDNHGSKNILSKSKRESCMQSNPNINAILGASTSPICVKRRMFFLMVYGVISDEPYTILKVTQESTTRDVLLLALQKASIPTTRINDFILVEEVARGWEKKDHDLPATQRILDLDERPLQAQSQWKGEGRFILKRMGDDPSSRAWLSSIRSVANREREARKSDGAPSNAWEENDTFLVCIYNVSPEIPYCILKVPLNACAQDVLAQALVKARRLEDPMNYVIVEELEWGGASHNVQQRALADDENVYKAQSHWQTIGRFIMQERTKVTPTSLRKNRVTTSFRSVTLDKISRGFTAARNAASSSMKPPVQAALSDPTTSKIKKLNDDSKMKGLLRSKANSEKETLQHKTQCQREVHSEGETLSDEETKDSDLVTAMTRLKRISIRKFKEWKS
ncbi:1-phosphatidylinositol 4,5-bisphosphate phosphodiesterase epsilon-1-like [Agrilus planipennis]|uniref:Phosphoinositide phospholipase C n=1 Tax=Agrilus planipennis TaxID=224129 RepID=A0A7F5R2L7_AGRPL|nr:1-phosphatidylinositol 4,5-bisphosphate phosphodiesterase epsilon-1-like [Agrilus planipennis]